MWLIGNTLPKVEAGLGTEYQFSEFPLKRKRGRIALQP